MEHQAKGMTDAKPTHKTKTLQLFDMLNQGPLYLFLISPKKNI
jgi:hypothetical protein